ncbi:MAG TPA: amidohydrolase family protein [Baekduia sp.]|nr:amidohydrolase family protein [Baekduia sp.]
MIIDAYNSAQNVRGRSDYLTGGNPDAPPRPFDVPKLLARMDAAGVDMAMVCSLAQRIEAEFIENLVAAYPDRLFGFGQVMPQADDALDEIARMARHPGIKGLKLHPSLHGYHFADHGLLDPVFAACREHGLAILVNALDDAFVSPLAIEEISRGFPEVPVLIAHMGSVWNVPEACIVAARNPQIYLETSATMLCDVRVAYARVGPEKIVMGTEYPGNDFDMERFKIAKAIESEADRALVEGGNLARILEL